MFANRKMNPTCWYVFGVLKLDYDKQWEKKKPVGICATSKDKLSCWMIWQ